MLLTNVYYAGRGKFPVTGMQAGVNLLEAGFNLSKPWKIHHDHIIILDIVTFVINVNSG